MGEPKHSMTSLTAWPLDSQRTSIVYVDTGGDCLVPSRI